MPDFWLLSSSEFAWCQIMATGATNPIAHCTSPLSDREEELASRTHREPSGLLAGENNSIPLFSECVPQLRFRGLHFTRCGVAEQESAQLVPLIIPHHESLFRVCTFECHPARLQAEVTDEVHFKIEHLGPKVWDLLIADTLLAGHIRTGHQPLFARIFPVRLAAHTSHDP